MFSEVADARYTNARPLKALIYSALHCFAIGLMIGAAGNALPEPAPSWHFQAGMTIFFIAFLSGMLSFIAGFVSYFFSRQARQGTAPTKIITAPRNWSEITTSQDRTNYIILPLVTLAYTICFSALGMTLPDIIKSLPVLNYGWSLYISLASVIVIGSTLFLISAVARNAIYSNTRRAPFFQSPYTDDADFARNWNMLAQQSPRHSLFGTSKFGILIQSLTDALFRDWNSLRAEVQCLNREQLLETVAGIQWITNQDDIPRNRRLLKLRSPQRVHCVARTRRELISHWTVGTVAYSVAYIISTHYTYLNKHLTWQEVLVLGAFVVLLGAPSGIFMLGFSSNRLDTYQALQTEDSLRHLSSHQHTTPRSPRSKVATASRKPHNSWRSSKPRRTKAPRNSTPHLTFLHNHPVETRPQATTATRLAQLLRRIVGLPPEPM